MASMPRSASVLRWVVKPLLFAGGMLPFGLLAYGALIGDLGADPLQRVTHTTGEWGLHFLLLTLTMTPLRRFGGWSWPLRLRRMLGLFAFFYASLHLLTWAWLDQGLEWTSIAADIAQRPYITVGFAAWLLLVPLALTSTRAAMRRMGGDWKRLHRLVYPVAVLVVLHYLWLVKADLLPPLLYAAILALLLLARWRPKRGQSSGHSRNRSQGAATKPARA